MSRTWHDRRAALIGVGREFWGRIPTGKIVRDFGGRWRRRLLSKTWRRWWRSEIREEQGMRDIAVGQRVRVFSGDGQEALGLGTYEGEAVVHTLMVMTEDKGPILYSSADDPTVEPPLPPGIPEGRYARSEVETPRIRLDSGEVVYGCQCWWEPVA